MSGIAMKPLELPRMSRFVSTAPLQAVRCPPWILPSKLLQPRAALLLLGTHDGGRLGPDVAGQRVPRNHASGRRRLATPPVEELGGIEAESEGTEQAAHDVMVRWEQSKLGPAGEASRSAEVRRGRTRYDLSPGCLFIFPRAFCSRPSSASP
ncbi:unnamed protein product [Urochloa humidicola]